jgi:hypothetical protein
VPLNLDGVQVVASATCERPRYDTMVHDGCDVSRIALASAPLHHRGARVNQPRRWLIGSRAYGAGRRYPVNAEEIDDRAPIGAGQSVGQSAKQ